MNMRLKAGIFGIEECHHAIPRLLQKRTNLGLVALVPITNRDVEPGHGRIGEQAAQRRSQQFQRVHGRGVEDVFVSGLPAHGGTDAGSTKAVLAGQHVLCQFLP